MDLIRLMNQNRKAGGLPSGAGLLDTKRATFAKEPADTSNKPKTLFQRREDIIKETPKIKIVREYFKTLVDRLGQMSEDEEDL